MSVEEGYARWAEGYDAYPNALIMLEEPLLRGLAGDVRGKRVLDTACGTGRHSVWFAEQGASVTGVDASEPMLEVARDKARSVTFLRGELAQLPVPDASFDLVVNALAMEHQADVGPAIAEAHRVLAPGGALVLSVFHPWFLFKGVPPHFLVAREGVEYEMPAWVHLPADYVTAVLRLGMKLTALVEPVVDDELLRKLPGMAKHTGWPLAILLRAEKA